MEALLQKCLNHAEVESFCDCVAKEKPSAPEAEAFCKKAETDKSITKENLEELNMALMEDDNDACCEC